MLLPELHTHQLTACSTSSFGYLIGSSKLSYSKVGLWFVLLSHNLLPPAYPTSINGNFISVVTQDKNLRIVFNAFLVLSPHRKPCFQICLQMFSLLSTKYFLNLTTLLFFYCCTITVVCIFYPPTYPTPESDHALSFPHQHPSFRPLSTFALIITVVT